MIQLLKFMTCVLVLVGFKLHSGVVNPILFCAVP
jgi:hypothetical protein